MKISIGLTTDYSGPTPPYWGSMSMDLIWGSGTGTPDDLDVTDAALIGMAEDLASRFQSGIPGSGNWSWTQIQVTELGGRLITP